MLQYLAINEQLIGAIELLATVRPDEAKAVIQQLRKLPQIKAATYINFR